MSKFNSYARKVDTFAKAAFKEYREAEENYRKAEAKAKEYPQRAGMVDANYAAKSARAHADLLEAQAKLKAAQQAFTDGNKEIAAIRSDLEAAVSDHYAADPAALDINTLELLKSGMLKNSEYMRLMNTAQAQGNYTMSRVIGKYAADAAEAAAKKYGDNSPQARELRSVSYMADADDGSGILQSFDVMANVYDRATKNPAMIDAWDELLSDTIAEF